MKADMNTLQKHIETQPVTDPNPASIRKLTLGELLRIDNARRHNVRKNWLRRVLGRFMRICRAFLPLLILAAASAETVVVDSWGTVLRRWPWPSDRTVVIPVPGPVVPPAGWPLQPNSFVLMTPAPAVTPRFMQPPAPIFRTGTPRPL